MLLCTCCRYLFGMSLPYTLNIVSVDFTTDIEGTFVTESKTLKVHCHWKQHIYVFFNFKLCQHVNSEWFSFFLASIYDCLQQSTFLWKTWFMASSLCFFQTSEICLPSCTTDFLLTVSLPHILPCVTQHSGCTSLRHSYVESARLIPVVMSRKPPLHLGCCFLKPKCTCFLYICEI